MKRVLRFELMKILNPLTLIYWVIFSIVLVLFCYDEPTFFKRFSSGNYRYNEDIIQSIFYIASYYKYFLVIFLIFLTSREFANNTIIRSIYEGFSREELFAGKLTVLAILILFVFILTRVILSILFLMKGYGIHTIYFMLFNYHFVIVEFFSCFFLGLLGIMMSSLTKNLYWSIGLFVAWAFIEYLAQLFLFMTPFENMINYLPVSGMIGVQQIIRYDDLGLPQFVYFYALQLFFLFVIYKQYKGITWLRKR
jgi:ABC-type transport system involved in multi-copper enzyme maturation permease subunit